MKKYLKLFYYGLLSMTAVLSTSCDNRLEMIRRGTSSPVLSLVSLDGKEGTDLKDSVKVSFKGPAIKYPITVKFSDLNKDVSRIRASCAAGGTFYDANGNESGGIVDVSQYKEGGQYSMSFSTKTEGAYVVSITVEDSFKGSSSGTYTLTAFKNLPPVASLAVSAVKVLSPYDYKFSGSKSIDQDAKYGGGLVQYSFDIEANGIAKRTITSRTPDLEYIFPQPGRYTVSLTVTDNDNVNSATVSTIVDVQ